MDPNPLHDPKGGWVVLVEELKLLPCDDEWGWWLVVEKRRMLLALFLDVADGSLLAVLMAGV